MTLVIAAKAELPPWIAGFFFLAAAAAMAAQMVHTYRAGFMYCGRSFQNGAFLEARKKENPLKYQIFFGVHVLIIVTLLAFSVLGFRRALYDGKKTGRAQPAATAATPLIAPVSPMISTLNMAQSFKRDGLPARRAWLI